MTEMIEFEPGGYFFIPGAEQYSAGVKAVRGLSVERVRFARPVPLASAFPEIARFLADEGRPLTSVCALELRSPAPFSESEFSAFSRIYRGGLEAWGLQRAGVIPVARSNVCPKIDPPAEPSVHAFSYTAARRLETPTFVIAGSCEVPEGKPNYEDFIVRYGDVSPSAMREKAEWVLKEIERRLAAFASDWSETTAIQVYTIHDYFDFAESLMGARRIFGNGLTWHLNRPPVVGLEFEMDCRRVQRELVIVGGRLR
jgi:hypothetical protein